jgi:ribosome biogenesis GTPase
LNQGIARVVATFGRHALIETDSRRRLHAHLRGRRSDVVVGDLVRWQPAGDEAVIEAVEPRRNLLRRQDAWRTKSFAANLDQVLLLVAVEPPLSEGQLTRALVAAADAGIPALLGLNKIDRPGSDAARTRLAPYRGFGLEVIELAAKADPQAAREALLPRLRQRTTLLLGPSGAGKSTLINLLVPDAEAQVGEISAALNAGRHTTTSTRWYWLGPGHDSALIDSPGFQQFGLQHLAPEQLAALMPDLAALLGGCRFYNCSHRQEPGCAVRAAVDDGRIDAQRYRLYLEIHDELSRAGGAG